MLCTRVTLEGRLILPWIETTTLLQEREAWVSLVFNDHSIEYSLESREGYRLIDVVGRALLEENRRVREATGVAEHLEQGWSVVCTRVRGFYGANLGLAFGRGGDGAESSGQKGEGEDRAHVGEEEQEVKEGRAEVGAEPMWCTILLLKAARSAKPSSRESRARRPSKLKASGLGLHRRVGPAQRFISSVSEDIYLLYMLTELPSSAPLQLKGPARRLGAPSRPIAH
jgi:hypothetical protein